MNIGVKIEGQKGESKIQTNEQGIVYRGSGGTRKMRKAKFNLCSLNDGHNRPDRVRYAFRVLYIIAIKSSFSALSSIYEVNKMLSENLYPPAGKKRQ